MGLRDLAKRAIHRALSGGAAPSSPPPARPGPAPEAPRAAAAPEAHPAGPAAHPAADHQTDRADKPWFLQGADDVDGWDETNPGAEPGQKNLRK
jgi:hypothetical protein